MKKTAGSKGKPKGALHILIIGMPGKNTPKKLNGAALKSPGSGKRV